MDEHRAGVGEALHHPFGAVAPGRGRAETAARRCLLSVVAVESARLGALAIVLPSLQGERGVRPVSKSVWDRIEEARARHNVLEHPFYVRWSAGELTSEELARYSGQYRHATEAIAKLSADVVATAPAEARDELAPPRRRGAGPHRALGRLRRGRRRHDRRRADSRDRRLRPRLDRAQRTTVEALARLYAIESGQPEIAQDQARGPRASSTASTRARRPSTSASTSRPTSSTPRSRAG